MKLKILQTNGNILVDAEILNSKSTSLILPSITDGWRFNFRKHSKGLGYQTYVLTSEDTPKTIEGCLIFQMKYKREPYMAFVEVAPHNKGVNKKYQSVAGCLIAYACRLSFIHGHNDYEGYLAFDVQEEDKQHEIKLMALYSTKYYALRYGKTSMIIPPKGGQKLIDEFINNGL